MDQAEKTDNSTPFRRALVYRDGLIIALLATDPIRLDNIATEIGRTLIKDGTIWSFEIPAKETDQGASPAPRRASRLECTLHRSVYLILSTTLPE
jgi:hypothetical protein